MVTWHENMERINPFSTILKDFFAHYFSENSDYCKVELLINGKEVLDVLLMRLTARSGFSLHLLSTYVKASFKGNVGSKD